MTDTTNSSGPAMKAAVRICGLIAIGAFFLPWFGGKGFLDFDKGIGGLQLIDRIIDFVVNSEDFSSISKGFARGTDGTAVAVFTFYVVLIPTAFALTGLYMLFTAKYSGGPMTFLIIFLVGSWLLFMLLGDGANIKDNFWVSARAGVWVGSAAMFFPFIGMFFLDKSI